LREAIAHILSVALHLWGEVISHNAQLDDFDFIPFFEKDLWGSSKKKK